MPDGDGVHLIEEFKRRQPVARILAISGGSSSLKGANCLTIASGFSAHAVLPKLFSRLQLFRGIEAALTLWVAETIRWDEFCSATTVFPASALGSYGQCGKSPA